MSVATAKAHDPSMEEILASIRRIIADDQDTDKPQPGGSEPRADGAGPGGAMEDLDVLDLAELSRPQPARHEPPTAPAPAVAEPAASLDVEVPDLSFQAAPEPPREAAVVRAAPGPTPLPNGPLPASKPAERPSAGAEPPASRPDLISREASSNVSQTFQLLSQTVLAQNNHTVEDLVKEMLRPMLRAWLDDHLPPLVERLVRNEIERVARGRS